MRIPAVVLALACAAMPAAAQRPAPRPAAPAAAPLPTMPVDSAALLNLRWRMIGPARGGRVTTVTGVPGQPFTFYMGSTGGGVWKTTDAGTTWQNVSDAYFTTGSMGAIGVAPSDPNVVYAATGSDGIRSNVSIGRGIWRSGDAGRSWVFAGLRDGGQVGALLVHPADPNTAWAAVIGNPFAPSNTRGVYRTTNGGRDWQRVLYVSDSTGAVDLELDPSNARVIYAAMWRAERKPWTIISGAREGGLYKSIDGGDTWTKLGGGLPDGLFGKADISISRARPSRVYALIEAPAPRGGLYRSDDAGATWSLINPQVTLTYRSFYYTKVTADPSNADIVFVCNETFFRSTDGGGTFRPLSTPHGDNHDLWINPEHPEIWVQSNDGGANVTLNGGRTWSTQYNQPTAEIYQVAIDDRFPYRVFGAQQDQGATMAVPSLPLTNAAAEPATQQWYATGGCETGPAVPKPGDADVVFAACKGQFSRYNVRTGEERHYWIGGQSLYGHDARDLTYRFQRVAPLEVSPHGTHPVYYASQYVHRTRDEGKTWETISPDLTANDPRHQGGSGEPITRDVTGEEFYSTLYAVRESPRAAGVIWAGANDGPVHVTRDNGKSWTNVTPAGLPPGGRVQNIEPSPHATGTAYIAVLRHLLGDFQPYAYRTDDYGATWTRLTTGDNGIPADEPVRVVREDPARAGLLYAGTEFGAYVSFDRGAHWQSLQRNLPHTPITDLRVANGDLVISTQGRSFWVMDDVSSLRQLTDGLAAVPLRLIAPRPAVRMRYEPSSGTAGGAEFPPPGARIDYWVGEGSARLKLEVFDSAGGLLRTFHGTAVNAADSAAQGMRRPGAAAAPVTIPVGRGMRRFTWDLTHFAAWDADSNRMQRGGPMVAPGRYRLRLSRGGDASEQWLDVRLDPRQLADGLTERDVNMQVAHNLRVRDALSAAKQLSERLRLARLRLANATGGAVGATADTLVLVRALEARLNTGPVRYTPGKLVTQLQYLLGMTTQADQVVGRDAVQRFATLQKELAAVSADVTALLGARDGRGAP